MKLKRPKFGRCHCGVRFLRSRGDRRKFCSRKCGIAGRRVKIAAFQRLWHYGMPEALLELLMNEQAGRCGACLEEITIEGYRSINVDHDHKCCPGRRSCGGCIRGLLCHRCNIALGVVKDSPRVLRGLLKYLGYRGVQ